MGSFSKTLSPALRLGYVIAPRALRDALLHAKHLADVHGPRPPQVALARFMAEGAYRRYLRRCQTAYGERREALQRSLPVRLQAWMRLIPAEAGFHQAALLQAAPLDAPRLAALARRVGVGLYPLQALGAPTDGLLMGLGRIAAQDVDPALARVAELLASA